MQDTVNEVPGAAFEGMIADSGMREIVSRNANQGAAPHIPFGKAVTWNSADDADQVRLPASGAEVTASIQGVAIAESTIELPAGATFGKFIDGKEVPVLRKGRIYVHAETAVDPNDGVFIRTATPGGTPPLASLGSFRNDDDGGDATECTRMRWVSKTSGAGLAIVEVNLP